MFLQHRIYAADKFNEQMVDWNESIHRDSLGCSRLQKSVQLSESERRLRCWKFIAFLQSSAYQWIPVYWVISGYRASIKSIHCIDFYFRAFGFFGGSFFLRPFSVLKAYFYIHIYILLFCASTLVAAPPCPRFIKSQTYQIYYYYPKKKLKAWYLGSSIILIYLRRWKKN